MRCPHCREEPCLCGHPVHVIPLNDMVDHDTSHDGDCVCGPRTEAVSRHDGSTNWLYIHHALDGREFSEGGHSIPTERTDR